MSEEFKANIRMKIHPEFYLIGNLGKISLFPCASVFFVKRGEIYFS